MSALRTATTSTTGSMTLSHVEKGRPRTIQRMFVKTEPLTRVAKKPMIRGTRRNFPRWRETKAFTRKAGCQGPCNFTGNVAQRKCRFGRRHNGKPCHKSRPQGAQKTRMSQIGGYGIHGNGPVGRHPAHIGTDGMQNDTNGKQQGCNGHPAVAVPRSFHGDEFRYFFFHLLSFLSSVVMDYLPSVFFSDGNVNGISPRLAKIHAKRKSAQNSPFSPHSS